MRHKDKQITDKKRKPDTHNPKKQPKKYNIDYFGQAVNLEFKYKLNFDQGGVLKIEKK